MFDVVVIGCGIVGSAIAYELSKYKLSVCVIEKENDVSMGATKANSAIIHAGYDPVPGSLMAKLNVRGAHLAKELAQKLDVPYDNCGAFVLAFRDEDVELLKELKRRGDANGVPGLEILTGDEARKLEPTLSENVVAALNAPSSAIISPWEYCLALAETAVKNGAELKLDTELISAKREKDYWSLKTNGGSIDARFVINAAGVSSDKVHDMMAPHSFDIIPSRGQYYLLDKCECQRAKRTIFQCPNELGKGVLVSPTVHGNLIVGPDSEIVEGENKATTAAGLAFVKEKSVLSVPSIDFRNSIRNFAGVRARSTSSDFIISYADGAENFIDAAGICSPGLSSAPAIGEYVAELLKEKMTLEKKDNFICERKRVKLKALNPEERAKLIEKNPKYGHIICRCETISEGEILDTFNTPIAPRTVDGVKRRVGAGMGRCQGGFCGPNVVAILAKAMSVKETEILQDGKGSYVLTNKIGE